MPLLNQIKKMQQEGKGDEEIAQELREQGLRPLEISEALEQAKIKAAVSQNERGMAQQIQSPQQTPYPQEQTEKMNSPLAKEEELEEDMHPSLMEQEQSQQSQEPLPTPEYQYEEQVPGETEEYIYPTPQAYAQYPEYQPYTEYQQTAETTTEIAESIIEEKLSKTRKELSSLQQFKTTAERKLSNLNERLKKIEDIIEKLQASIIGKIGNYSQNIEDIKKEMQLMQESFSKALPSLAENETRKAKKKKTTKAKKRKSGIEHYLRR